MIRNLLLLVMLAAASVANAEPWTYSGTLSDGGTPANGRYDLRVTLLDASGPDHVGSPITFYSVQVHDGTFTVQVDFGSDLGNAPPMRLKTEVSKDNAPFVALGEPTRFDPKVALAGVCWDTEGNSGTNPANNFIGTTDNQPLVIRAFNTPVLRIFPRPNSPNLVAGAAGNSAQAFEIGQVVAGGGQVGDCAGSTCTNLTQASYATVSGGLANHAIGERSTVAGGFINRATGTDSVVGGGSSNIASGDSSVVGGGIDNCAGGDLSWAGGYHAKIRPGNGVGDGTCVTNSGDDDGDNGTFIWADDQGTNFTSTGARQFLVRADGGVGINTATLGAAANLRLSELVVKNSTGDGNADISLMNTNNRGFNFVAVPGASTNAGEFFIGAVDARTTTVSFTNRLRIDAAGTTFVQGGAVGNLSDARLKKNIGPIARPLDQLLALQGHVYEYIDPAKAMNAAGPRMGFVAQEVQTVLPNWVQPTGNEGYLAVTPIGFEALTVEAMRDLKAESDIRMEALEKENASLRSRLEALEAKVMR